VAAAAFKKLLSNSLETPGSARRPLALEEKAISPSKQV